MRKQRLRRFSVAVLIGAAFAALVIFTNPVSAVPSFARKYRTSCITCHVAPPKLNAFGHAFKNLGYRMPGNDEDLVKQPKVPLGSPAWKQVWPGGVWPADIPGGTFIAANVESNFIVNPSADVSNEFDGIDEIGLLLGGTIGESFSFFGDVPLFEGGQPGGVERLFIQYNNPGHLFNIEFGQFEPRAVPFSNHLRLIRETGYLADVFPTIPAANFFGFSPSQRGLEIWGGKEGPSGKGGLLWGGGVVNGEFGGAADDLEDSPAIGPLLDALKENAQATGGEFDSNSGKDVYGALSYKFGGMGIFGSGAENVIQQTNNWRDDSFTLGGYVYRGIAPTFLNLTTGEAYSPNGNDFIRTGATFNWWFKDLNLFGGYQFNRDSLKDGRLFHVGITTVEANYVTHWPWIQPGIRFENVNPNFAPAFRRTTVSALLLIRANTLLSLEEDFSSNKAPDLPPFDDQFQAMFRILF
jgi:hypothetical protein